MECGLFNPEKNGRGSEKLEARRGVGRAFVYFSVPSAFSAGLFNFDVFRYNLANFRVKMILFGAFFGFFGYL